MYGMVRDSPFGQIVRFVTKNKYFRYPEEQEGFTHPYYTSDPFPKEAEAEQSTTSNAGLEDAATLGSDKQDDRNATGDVPTSGSDEDLENNNTENPIERVITMQSQHEAHRTESRAIKPTQTGDGMIVVDWYTTGIKPFSLSPWFYFILDWLNNRVLDDPENPQNWNAFQKGFIAFQIW